MIIYNVDTYKDGGTVKVETNEGTYYIDRRLKSETRGRIYDDYPRDGNIVENEEETRQRLCDFLDYYNAPNMDSVREFIKQ